MKTNELLSVKEMMEHKYSSKIPEPGFHAARVIEAVTEPNSRGTGSVLKVKLEITEGDDKGVVIKDSINILHVDGYTQMKGLSWLHYFNVACGFEPGYYPSDTDEYLGKTLRIKLSDKKGEAFTVIRYEPAGTSSKDSLLSKLNGLFLRKKD